MRVLEGTGGICSLLAALLLTFAAANNHSGETETHHASAGRLLLLKCHFRHAHTNVTWSRAGSQNGSLPSGVEVRDGLLWFLPVQTSHAGTYTCEKRYKTGPLKMNFGVSVSSGECPDPSENISTSRGVILGLPCKQREIFRLNNRRSIRWMKDCRLIEPMSLKEDGYMRLHPASEEDAGNYTCLVNVSLDGRTYTAARSIQLTMKDITRVIITEPMVLFPRGQVVLVEVGMRAELECKAFIGFSEDHITYMYWTIGGTFTEEHEGLKESWKYTHDSGMVYGLSTLSISKVPRLFLDVPIHCHIVTQTGEKDGLVLLQEADHSAFYTTIALCLTGIIASLALAAGSLFFKIEVVLAYRKLLRYFSKQAPDGKLYDGYVSFLHPDTLSSSETENFALHILPEELEKKHGYSLYIRGRDDCPGEALHDVIAATLQKCCRLIILLSNETKSPTEVKTEEMSPLCNDQNQLCYEQTIGIYDALTQNDTRVILVEIGGPVDYNRLPESLHYIKRKQGALKWENASPGTQSLSKLHSTRKFWKKLRYHMPSVPVGKHQTII
ncbi:interleukin-1 receptor type 1 isoform X1 [Pleuronectes platessa]|uniref:interleukin-1 receptor type 1 isoform X1 n=1 Tax=Pleuronectes platessa TaxID=8262 RepID=UPI00232A2AEE|nr:interleukin-1 receptor type 1 isoform X1 [Pleuronectes platessa]